MPPTESDAGDLPRKIGPYRVLRRLGAGGMGEVFEAADDRLDRRVAIKRLARSTEEGSQARRRLRQEARTAARLNHPALVQIYDILELEEGDFLVLELAEGTTLRQRIERGGPLPSPELLGLCRQLAKGLEHAHRRGIVHRDLKPGNVLLTEAGQAKIADFGIAKSRDPEAEGLTRDNVVVGTYRNMSPEQARGESLDHRSDLFTLGLLLYEAATGSNPFVGDSPLATLRRIVQDEAPPLRARRPDLPPDFVDLVHGLLAKAPELRPQSAGGVLRRLAGLEDAGDGATTVTDVPREETGSAGIPPEPSDEGPPDGDPGAPARPPQSSDAAAGQRRPSRRRVWVSGAVLAAAGVAGILLIAPDGHPGEPLTVAVPLPRGDGGEETAGKDLLPHAVRFSLLTALTELEGISVLPTAEVDAAGASPAAVARATRADEVLDSELDCRGLRCWVTLSRVGDGGQRLLWTERLEAPADNPFLLSQAVAAFLRQGYPELERQPFPPSLEVRPRDYEEFLRLEQSHRRKEGGLSGGDILDRLQALRRTSPHFLEGYLLSAEILRLRFVSRRDRDDLDTAFSLLAAARRLAPDHPRPLYFVFNAALSGGRLEDAAAALRQLEALDPGASQIGTLRAHLLEARGDGAAALEEMRRATERRPSVLNLSNLAEKELNLGRVEESRRHLLQALELAPKDFTLRSRLAVLELLAGDPARAAELYSELVELNPGFAELSNLGLALLLEGRFEQASERFEQALELAPRNAFAMLNLADARWLAGDEEAAAELYRRLLSAIAEDPAAGGWQFLTVEAQALAHLGHGQEATAAAAEARRLAPDNAQVAYESALVATVSDNLEVARSQALRALDLGYDRRWFGFPWFDTLRQDPAFRRRLEGGS